MSLHQFMLALLARRKTFGLVLAATVLTTILVSLVIPRTYVATASLLVDARDGQSMASEIPGSPRERTGYLSTQVDIITSRPTARRVVEDLKLASDPRLREAWESDTGGKGSPEDWIAAELLKTLKVDTSQSSVLQVIVAARDAQLAADVANGFAKAYVDTALELRTGPSRQAAAWFDDQLKELRANLEQAQSKLSGYLEQRGIVAEDERSDTENTRLAELSTQYSAAQNATFEAATRQKQAQAAIAAGGAENLPEVIGNPLVQTLKTSLAQAEARMRELTAHLGPNHPQYQRQAAELNGLRERLRYEIGRVANGIDSAAAQAREREAALRNAMAAQRAQVLARKQYRSEMAVLTREVDTAQRMYDTALARYVVNKVESRASQTNVAVLNPAIAPLKHQRPQVTLNALLSVIVGMILGLGAVYMLETLDPRVRSRGDLESQLNLPLLVVLDDGHFGAGRRLLGGPAAAPALAAPQ
jgi:chain length determinant protein EpsF